MANDEVYEKLNDYTLSVTTDFQRNSGSDPELRRIFNLRARQITSIFSQYVSGGVGNSMMVQKFSELDSLDEAELMRQKLIELKGTPPEIQPALDKPTVRGPSLQP